MTYPHFCDVSDHVLFVKSVTRCARNRVLVPLRTPTIHGTLHSNYDSDISVRYRLRRENIRKLFRRKNTKKNHFCHPGEFCHFKHLRIHRKNTHDRNTFRCLKPKQVFNYFCFAKNMTRLEIRRSRDVNESDISWGC